MRKFTKSEAGRANKPNRAAGQTLSDAKHAYFTIPVGESAVDRRLLFIGFNNCTERREMATVPTKFMSLEFIGGVGAKPFKAVVEQLDMAAAIHRCQSNGDVRRNRPSIRFPVL